MKGYRTDEKGNHIHDTAWIGDNVIIGQNNTFHAFCVIGSPPKRVIETDEERGPIIIGDNNEFFEFTVVRHTLTKGKTTTIGHNCTICSHSTIGAGVQLGTNKVVTPHSTITQP